MVSERLASSAIETLLNTIEANDAVTGAHVRRVAAYALCLADAAGLDDRQKYSVERVALFHDIGKLDEALTDIFHDKAKLTQAEWRAVKKHPEKGAKVLEPLSFFYPDLGKGVMAHHERWDGKGYPRQLRGGRIPLVARIVSIADSFDAITHRRRYSKGRSFREATAAILEGRGAQFDPDLVDLFFSPPVIGQIQAIMLKAHVPCRQLRGRRIGSRAAAPDLNFRWRERAFPKRAVRPSRRKSS